MHKNEKIVRALLDEVHKGDVSAVAPEDYFTDEAYYQPLVPAVHPIQGSQEILAEISRQLVIYTDLQAEIHVLIATDDYVFTERTDHARILANDKKVSIPLMAIYEFSADGKIKAWREIFDTGYAACQIDVDMDDMAQITGSV
ncbi:MAG: nuclear transport factor 2 family protein [Spongiibacteraceae bacterium]